MTKQKCEFSDKEICKNNIANICIFNNSFDKDKCCMIPIYVKILKINKRFIKCIQA